jgi:hypothetical protein
MNGFWIAVGRPGIRVLALLLAGCATASSAPDARDAVGPCKGIALVPDARSSADMRVTADAEGYPWLDATRLAGRG